MESDDEMAADYGPASPATPCRTRARKGKMLGRVIPCSNPPAPKGPPH